VIGSIAGLLNLTPYRHWRWQHALHHGTSGDLDRRGSGDIWTLTVQEYLESTRWTRVAYRLARNPVVLFVIAPLYLFVVHHRFASAAAAIRGISPFEGRSDRELVIDDGIHASARAAAHLALKTLFTVEWNTRSTHSLPVSSQWISRWPALSATYQHG
jgi:hypothetical protein